MKVKTFGFGLALAAALTLGAAFSQDALANGDKQKMVVTSLVKGPLAGVDGKSVIISRITVPAGFKFGRHFHPGAVFVYVLEGTLLIRTDSGTVTVSKGEVYQEVPRVMMTAENMSASKAAKIVVFQVGDTGKPMMIMAK